MDMSKGEVKDHVGDASGGASFETFPHGSHFLAVVKEAKWVEFNGVEYINVQWKILQPEAVGGNTVFQKLYVKPNKPRVKDPAKAAEKAMDMLLVMDHLAGGTMRAIGGAPTDSGLASLKDKPMMIAVGYWAFTPDDGDPMEGNNVSFIGKAGSLEPHLTEPNKAQMKFNANAAVNKPASQKEMAYDGSDDSDIPF